ncbi:Dynamin central region domain containing protein [Theileria equi strain WA]|uniref:Dynamin central region domain containing protein n=1 Tax=Theileria equi strain WA TaxID=1537102 RepID=L0AVH7_THEEQ|nr:Dynamin central region domain containing protein [Theileria equi strain WA]AFZ79026.1 Dynamin central region domain containing protein [Theileria equi strain WA]|eukprot:XP_004828692.1 Dynamin central region domain containing protein [Theileria equi strain WA]
MEKLIPLISRLHGILSWTGDSAIDLPAIAVIGAQSVGKSSVLEAIVGFPFLPKGSGIVTQRPLIMRLCHDKNSKDYGEFAHKRGVIFDDFQKIKEEIIAETERITGSTKNVSSVPIFLKITSPKVIDLTLIDLPGITKVPVGDQTNDIEMQIRQMILEYITKPTCIILALSAANTDIATSDSLKMAREVDPSGLRTIGVITKCDMLDDGVDALDLLQGKIYKLKKGYVGVVCREKGSGSLSHNHADEEMFFKNHPSYSSIAKKCGIRHLTTLLNEMLSAHIKDMLPYVKSRILTILHDHEGELNAYGINDIVDAPGACLLHFFTKFSQRFKDTIDGKIVPRHHTSRLYGGARIYFIFNDSFLRTLNAFSPLSGLSDIEIRTAIRNSTGPYSALFVPEIAFENLVKKQIKLLECPSLQCVDQVYEELQNILENCDVPEINRYMNMRNKILSVVKELLKQCLEPTKDIIRNIIKIELAYINTNHPDFLRNSALAEIYNGTGMNQKSDYITSFNGNDSSTGNINKCEINEQSGIEKLKYDSSPKVFAMKHDGFYKPSLQHPRNDLSPKAILQSNKALMEKVNENHNTIWLPNIPKVVMLNNDPSEREIVETELIKTLISSYFSIVRKNVADAVPKCIMHFMVNKATESLQQELISKLYKRELYDELMAESKHVIERREKCLHVVKCLKEALVDITELSEYKIME